MAVFVEPARALEWPIPQGDAGYSLMQGPRYTNEDRLLAATSLADLFEMANDDTGDGVTDG